MNTAEMIFRIFGGLGLFLYGMKLMSEGLQKAAGERLRAVFNALTTNRIAGVVTGITVTATIQSSSATTVMLVGFVNAGLMSLQQAINVVLGANIGTTITGWLVAFKVVKYGLLLVGSGVGLIMFSKSDRNKYIGEIVLGLGMLFFGLTLMQEGLAPLRDVPKFKEIFTIFAGENTFQVMMGALMGCMLTAVVQSSSATVGITMGLASQGLISFPAAVALILGENIGTTITALLASIGTSVNARRTALAHSMFNIIGVCYMVALFPLYIRLVDAIIPGLADATLANGTKPYIMAHIAASHTMFNVFNVILFIPFAGVLTKVVTRLVKDKPGAVFDKKKPVFTYLRVVGIPGLMISEARREIERMYDTAMLMFLCSRDMLFNIEHPDVELRQKNEQYEKEVDDMQQELVKFLALLSRQSGLNSQDIQDIHIYNRIVDETESIGDYCRRLSRLSFKKTKEQIVFSEDAAKSLEPVYAELTEYLSLTRNCFLVRSQDSFEICEAKKQQVNKLIREARDAHTARLQENVCEVLPATYFNNILNNLRRIRSHVTNVVEASMGQK
jgi:phosphate:Na+ symporter